MIDTLPRIDTDTAFRRAKAMALAPHWTPGQVIHALEGRYGPGTYEYAWRMVADIDRPHIDDEHTVVRRLLCHHFGEV